MFILTYLITEQQIQINFQQGMKKNYHRKNSVDNDSLINFIDFPKTLGVNGLLRCDNLDLLYDCITKKLQSRLMVAMIYKFHKVE